MDAWIRRSSWCHFGHWRDSLTYHNFPFKGTFSSFLHMSQHIQLKFKNFDLVEKVGWWHRIPLHVGLLQCRWEGSMCLGPSSPSSSLPPQNSGQASQQLKLDPSSTRQSGVARSCHLGLLCINRSTSWLGVLPSFKLQ